MKDTHLVKKFPTLTWTLRFITMFTRACSWALLWATWLQSTATDK